MKKMLLGIATALMMTAPASAFPSNEIYVQYTYLDDNGAYIGRLTIYCNGLEVAEGTIYAANYTVIYGDCIAP